MESITKTGATAPPVASAPPQSAASYSYRKSSPPPVPPRLEVDNDTQVAERTEIGTTALALADVPVESHRSLLRCDHDLIGKIYRLIFERNSSWLTSFLVHLSLMIILALIVIPLQRTELISLEMSPPNFDTVELRLNSFELDSNIDLPTNNAPLEFDAMEMDVVPVISADHTPVPTAVDVNLLQKINEFVPLGDMEIRIPSSPPGSISGRTSRRGNALKLGATKESEEAVELALKWLAAHQEYRGGWRFDIHRGKCRGSCRHSGTANQAVNGATGLALLPFLGAGHTHETGEYQVVVRRGLEYLIRNQQPDGSFHEPQGNMYSHGLATLALCEALAMAQESSSTNKGRFNVRLRRATRLAIEFMIAAQATNGGWRYAPRQSGDTSIGGWQAMALQSAKMSGIRIPESVYEGISSFLDSVKADIYGSTYGYTNPAPRASTSSIGLLCRMYLGWSREHPGITNGAEYLGEIGPSTNNVYYNYYATQVMHHYGGPIWENWNNLLRDHLVHSQARKGHEEGSWHYDGDFGSGIGGRLYITAMCAMTLEVYYRHMPIYSERAVNNHTKIGMPPNK